VPKGTEMKHLLITSLTILIGFSASASTTNEEHPCPGGRMPLGAVPGIAAPYNVTIQKESCSVDSQYLFVQGIPKIGVTYVYSFEGGFMDVHMVGSVLYYDLPYGINSASCVTYWEDLSE
jgi:hypothetical protein